MMTDSGREALQFAIAARAAQLLQSSQSRWLSLAVVRPVMKEQGPDRLELHLVTVHNGESKASESKHSELEPLLTERQGAVVRIGRQEEDNTWPSASLRDSEVSQEHLELSWDSAGREWSCRDLASSNGTRLNGRSLPPQGALSLVLHVLSVDLQVADLAAPAAEPSPALKSGDLLRLGGYVTLLVEVSGHLQLLSSDAMWEDDAGHSAGLATCRGHSLHRGLPARASRPAAGSMSGLGWSWYMCSMSRQRLRAVTCRPSGRHEQTSGGLELCTSSSDPDNCGLSGKCREGRARTELGQAQCVPSADISADV